MKSHFLFILIACMLCSCQEPKGEYVCKPCDLPCDELTFAKPGTCPSCNMVLLKVTNLVPEKLISLDDTNIEMGSHAFLFKPKNTTNPIRVFYHMPKSFKPTSNILIVVPGAGRNADSYRDTWVEASEKHGVLILAPMYPENTYGFGDYHIGGLIKDLNLNKSIAYIENTNVAKLDESRFKFTVNSNSDQWIFNDFDALFDTVVTKTKSETTRYDLFGHSAGGHILHRYAIFHKNSKADRIIASNASFYTLASFDYPLPFGLKDSPANHTSLKSAFSEKLVLFLGELDNENETGGTFLRSISADKQGLHRLERGQFFFNTAQEQAKELGYDFNWQMVIVPGIGHDQQLMGQAAGDYLYGDTQ